MNSFSGQLTIFLDKLILLLLLKVFDLSWLHKKGQHLALIKWKKPYISVEGNDPLHFIVYRKTVWSFFLYIYMWTDLPRFQLLPNSALIYLGRTFLEHIYINVFPHFNIQFLKVTMEWKRHNRELPLASNTRKNIHKTDKEQINFAEPWLKTETREQRFLKILTWVKIFEFKVGFRKLFKSLKNWRK